MPDGGLLTIDMANAVIDPARAARYDVAPGDYVCLCVSDTGTGMTPEVSSRAFDPSSPPSRSARAPAWACR
jgi:signal transduction histidine kinase